MIIECGSGLVFVLTVETGIDSAVLDELEMGCDLILKMNTKAMDNTIALGM
jgi:hypothetical protein